MHLKFIQTSHLDYLIGLGTTILNKANLRNLHIIFSRRMIGLAYLVHIFSSCDSRPNRVTYMASLYLDEKLLTLYNCHHFQNTQRSSSFNISISKRLMQNYTQGSNLEKKNIRDI